MFVAQTAVLQGCSTELLRLLHQNGSCLLAARIFVVSRLVLKSLQEKVVLGPSSSIMNIDSDDNRVLQHFRLSHPFETRW